MNPHIHETPKGSKHNRRTGVLAAVGGIVLIIVTIILFVAFTNVSKQDYAEATKSFETVQTELGAYTVQNEAFIVATKDGSDAEYEAQKTKLAEATTQLEDANKALSKLKAAKFSESGKLYKEFNRKLTEYTAYRETVAKAAEQARPFFAACAKISDAETTNAQIEATKKCSAVADTIGTLSDEALNAWVVAMKEHYVRYAKALEDINVLKDPYGAQYEQYKTLRAIRFAVVDEVKASTDAYTEQAKADEAEVNPNVTAEAVKAYLVKSSV